MPMATITKVSGERNLYHIHVLDPHAGHPDAGLPGDSGVDPGYGQGRPGLEHPGNRPPGSGVNFPSNTLPSGPPPHVQPGQTLVLVRDPAGVWHYATLAPGAAPPVIAPPIAPTPAPKPA